MIPITLNLSLHFDERITIFQVQFIGRMLSLKDVWTRSTTRSQCLVYGSFSLVDYAINPCRCSTRIQNVPPDWCCCRCHTSHMTSYPWRVESSMGDGSISNGTFSLGMGTHVYSTIRSTVILVMVKWEGIIVIYNIIQILTPRIYLNLFK